MSVKDPSKNEEKESQTKIEYNNKNDAVCYNVFSQYTLLQTLYNNCDIHNVVVEFLNRWCVLLVAVIIITLTQKDEI